MAGPRPGKEIVDPARIKAMIPKKPEDMGLGSLGAWADWLRAKPPAKKPQGDNTRK